MPETGNRLPESVIYVIQIAGKRKWLDEARIGFSRYGRSLGSISNEVRFPAGSYHDRRLHIETDKFSRLTVRSHMRSEACDPRFPQPRK